MIKPYTQKSAKLVGAKSAQIRVKVSDEELILYIPVNRCTYLELVLID